MKTNNSKFNFVSIFKYIMIVPIVMALASIIIGAICGFNLDYDYKNVSTFTVKFNTTLSEKEYSVFEDKVEDILVKYDFDSTRMERIGEDAENALLVKIVNEDNKLDDVITELKEELEESLYGSVADKLDRDFYISTSDTITNVPTNSSKMIWYSVLSIGCILVLAFLYMLIRYNLMAGVSVVLAVLLNLAMLTSANIIFRIPLNKGFMLAYMVSTLLVVFISIIIHNALKKTINDDAFAKYSNEERIYHVVNLKFMIKTLIYLAFIALPLVILAIFSSVSMLFTILSILIGMIIAVFVSTIFAPSIWSFWYKRDKDIMLKRRKDREQKKLENKDKNDEKILV